MKYNLEQIEKLMDSAGNLYLCGTQIIEHKAGMVRYLSHGDFVPGKYLFCDGILTHIKNTRKAGAYTFYVGKIKGLNVVSDGINYAHCDKLRDGISDLLFKTASDRGAAQYKDCTLDTEMTAAEAVSMYRIITGACKQGSEAFVQSLGDKLKEKYTIREMIQITKGQYNADKFARFFGQ